MLIVGFHLDSSSQVGIVSVTPSKSFVYWYKIIDSLLTGGDLFPKDIF